MVSYPPSRGKAAVLLSTVYHTATTEGEDKPEIVLHGPPGYDLFLQKKKQLMAKGPLL